MQGYGHVGPEKGLVIAIVYFVPNKSRTYRSRDKLDNLVDGACRSGRTESKLGDISLRHVPQEWNDSGEDGVHGSMRITRRVN